MRISTALPVTLAAARLLAAAVMAALILLVLPGARPVAAETSGAPSAIAAIHGVLTAAAVKGSSPF